MKGLWIVLLLAAAFAGVVLLGRSLEGRRSRGLESAAARLGLAGKSPRDAEAQGFSRLPLFAQGHGGRFRDVASRPGLWVFGYSFETGQGKTETTYSQTGVAIELPGRALTPFSLFPKSLRARGGGPGGRAYDVGADRGYRLTGSLPAGVDLEPRLAELSTSPGDAWAVEGEGSWIVLYRPGQRTEAADLARFVAEAESVARLF